MMPTTRLKLMLATFALVIPLGNRLYSQEERSRIVLGMSAPFEGPARALGIELYRGSMAYFDEINKKGGVFGHRIAIKPSNDSYEPIPAVTNTIEFVQDDRVFALYGYVGTPTVTRVLPLLRVYDDKSIFLFFPFTGAEPQRRPPYSKYVFNLRPSYSMETEGIVGRFCELGRKRIAVFYQCDAYGRAGWEGVRRALTASYHLEVVAEATYPRGQTFADSFRAQVQHLRDANVDAVVSIGSYEPCAGFIRDARDAGWDVPIANVSFVGSEQMLARLLECGQERQKDYTANLINSQVLPSYEDVTLPAIREYRALMENYGGMPPDIAIANYKPSQFSYVSLEGFLDAKCLVKMLEALGHDLDRTKLRPVVGAMQSLDLGIDAPASFAPGRAQGLEGVYYTTVDKGRFVPITDWSRWKL
jgi:ABC-type branched-subunit amino acid transport system substrate-binding protein